jgi:hypothetical protein
MYFSNYEPLVENLGAVRKKRGGQSKDFRRDGNICAVDRQGWFYKQAYLL